MFGLSLVLFLFTMGISLIAVMRTKSVFLHYSQIPTQSGLTGAEVAARILSAAGIHDVQIIENEGMLSDHYDPLNKRLVLSRENYHGTSVAAAGVSAHECGHAIQHKIAYAPLKWRMASVGITTYANQVVMWLPLLGMFTHAISPYTGLMIMAVAWGIIMLFNLITLPVEFDASRRAKLVLPKMNLITSPAEEEGVRKVLDTAGWTYVAAFITSLLYFMWYLLPILLGGRRND